MQAALGDILFAFVEGDQLWLSPTYQKQEGWWQVPLDVRQLRRNKALDYAQTLVEAYLRVHPGEQHRVGPARILTILLEALDPLTK
ncbi:hypothetical protein [Hymenobacter sp. GOD-10R]|uniref:hypothetical protein n=1 Tax=Hymenobacter sp. GOD-10R TaxID=3093922 RepID=UPI002D78231F|nr:hypothetical protein [Hymenobacter sp. GOD-10R]WRQ31914.1 hypothetical protein SD425_29645 [Hymenobacter sp. GOD-10R]